MSRLKPYMLLNFFASKFLLSCFFFLSLTSELYFLIPVFVAQIFHPTAELTMPIGISSKEAKSKIETHPVTAEA